MQKGCAVGCHANVLEPEETEEQLDLQGLRYPMSKKELFLMYQTYKEPNQKYLVILSFRVVQDHQEAKDILEMRVDL